MTTLSAIKFMWIENTKDFNTKKRFEYVNMWKGT